MTQAANGYLQILSNDLHRFAESSVETAQTPRYLCLDLPTLQNSCLFKDPAQQDV